MSLFGNQCKQCVSMQVRLYQTVYRRTFRTFFQVWPNANSPQSSGAIEDVQHFLLECPNYHVPRETLRRSLFLSCGIADFDTEILLSVTDDEDLKDIRPLIWDQLDMYITQTKRF